MENNNDIDVLLIGRPDHSLLIYEELLKQSDITYHFITFKCLPRWMGCFQLFSRRFVSLKKCYTISVLTSLYNVLYYKFSWHWLSRYSESTLFRKTVERTTKSKIARIVHYWPEYCYESMKSYKKIHPNAILIADAHMPNPIAVISAMREAYQKHGLIFCNPYLESYSKCIYKHFVAADYILVPSKYVQDTLCLSYPNKNYIVVDYGINIYKGYNGCRALKGITQVKSFVYVGNVSLEKGCDILLEYFSKHKNVEIHLYGALNSRQRDIFLQYDIHPNIIFHGAVPKAILQEEISKYDIGIHLSRFDAYSLGVGEIIGCGLPVVVSDHTGIADVIIKHELGLVTRLEMDDIEKNISRIISPNKYNYYCENVDKYIKSNPLSYGEAMVKLYNQLKQ